MIFALDKNKTIIVQLKEKFQKGQSL